MPNALIHLLVYVAALAFYAFSPAIGQAVGMEPVRVVVITLFSVVILRLHPTIHARWRSNQLRLFTRERRPSVFSIISLGMLLGAAIVGRTMDVGFMLAGVVFMGAVIATVNATWPVLAEIEDTPPEQGG
ncbi:hypothetical protein [Brevundimonas sp. P7753]|uniref:hypothetical protein n=1 Tax=Brevundimonas sp. P7753 TaxID=2726982 RepID=UPI0015BA1A7C|nr:hypothetical protein [Brevundimonas sp. P7753]NWE54213.1 hypothetical protein [Brevundimonas sp. P7753]